MKVLHRLDLLVTYMRLGRWMADHGFSFGRRVRDRFGVFDAILRRVATQRVLYLEFGVCKGTSMRYWSRQLKNPDARLHGFDSFEGLPEDFDMDLQLLKGTFSTDGVMPVIEDSRVRFFKGWFEKVLPTYALPEHDVLVVNLDADLYSSTIYVLRHLRPWIRAGTFIYLDEMNRLEHEPKAFGEFLRESGLRFQAFCADRSLKNVVFQCVA